MPILKKTSIERSTIWGMYICRKRISKAVEAYKNALRNNPADEETRYNYALAKELLENEKPPEEQEQDDKKDQDQQDKDQEDEQEKDQDQEGDQENKDEQDQDQKGDEGDESDKEGEPKNEGDQKKDQKPNEGKTNLKKKATSKTRTAFSSASSKPVRSHEQSGKESTR